MTFTVKLSEEAEADLKAISDRQTRQIIERGLLRLESEPKKRGKPLTAVLRGHYSIRLARRRYRAVYRVATKEGVVTVEVIGIRKEGDKRDVYRVARKRLGKKD